MDGGKIEKKSFEFQSFEWLDIFLKDFRRHNCVFCCVFGCLHDESALR